LAKLVVASRNEHKVKEIREILGGQPWEILSLADFPQLPEVVEDQDTFVGNALKKAKEIAASTGLLTLADDSGLEVDALDGRPGVYSARFAGPKATDGENNEKLLKLLADVPQEKRTARFRCVIAIAKPDGWSTYVEGHCRGVIGYAPAGSGGFGYDPLFYVPSLEKTFAQLSPEEKNAISHRGKALQAAVKVLAELAAQES
jgi:XTP/dITP diphosphohydrolase